MTDFLPLTYDGAGLAMRPEAVAAMTRGERAHRLGDLIREAHTLVGLAEEKFIDDAGRKTAARVVLFSGGNDSTVLAHLMRGRATHAAHANTGVGVEETRQFVRDVCRGWNLPLLERAAPNPQDAYRALVLERGFPGPAQHFKMFQRLKERALRVVLAELVGNPRKNRVLFIAGRRRTESERRALLPEMDRVGSAVYVSPLVNWTKPDLQTYRLIHEDVPRNRVSDLIHMSGECLCGAFAKPDERLEIETWFPLAFEDIARLEAEIADRADIPPHRRRWGWGGDPANAHLLSASRRTGRLCSSACGTPSLFQ